jgi:hypothetical protein
VSFISDFSKNGCLLRSTNKVRKDKQWSGLNYSTTYLSFNNNNLLVGGVLCGVLFFTATRFIKQPVNVFALRRHANPHQ